MNIRPVFRFAGAALLALAPRIAEADAYGPQFQVNTVTSPNLGTLDNLDAVFAASTGANGDSVVLWQDGPVGAVTNYIQRYDASGRRLQNQEWSVGTGARGVAVSGSGSFAIVRNQSDGAGSGVFVTIYNRAGSVIAPQVRVNDTLTGEQRAETIAMNASGTFVVGWSSVTTGGNPAYYTKLFAANGAAMSGETLVHANGAAAGLRLMGLDVAIDSVGNHVAAFSYGDIFTAAWSDVWARRFSSNGAALGPAFQVNSSTVGGQYHAKIAMNPSGSFVIVWTSGQLALGQRYNATGLALGGEFRINPRNSTLEGLDLALATDASFIVTWHDNGSGAPQILGRYYTAVGTALGDPFSIGSSNNNFLTTNLVGMDADGNAFVTWLQHHYSNQQPRAILARRYSAAGTTAAPVVNGQIVPGLSGTPGSWRYFKFSVPQGHNTVELSISGGTGDADLYVRWGALPTLDTWHGRPYLDGNNEDVRMLNFPPGDWYIGVQGFSAYQGLQLRSVSR
jgi:serine protease